MQINIKGRHNLVIPQDLKDYILDKLDKVLEGLSEPVMCDVMLADARGAKSGHDKVIHINVTAGHIKNPVYVDIVTDDFFKSADLIIDKFSRALHHAKR